MKCKWHNCNKQTEIGKRGKQLIFCSDKCKNKHCVSKRRKKLKQMAIEYCGGKCQLCSYSKCLWALEFHHLDSAKKDFSIGSSGITKSWETTKLELDKCILVCANCHREIHSKLIILDSNLTLQKYTIQSYVSIKVENENKCIDCNLQLLNKSKRCKQCNCTYRFNNIYPSPEILSKLIWEHTTTKIAKDIGVSDNALAKYCKKHNILKPPRGYWAKLKAVINKQ